MTRARTQIRLVCWNEARGEELAAELSSAGFTAAAGVIDADALRSLRQTPPDAVVIDLGRLPAQGRDVGVALRTSARTRSVPLVFIGGQEEKVARTKEHLPDAFFASREEMAEAVTLAINEPPVDPVVPSSNLAGYSGTPLPKKLGIKAGCLLSLVAAPDDFESTLGDLPDGVTVLHRAAPDADVTVWFVRSLAELEKGIEKMGEVAGSGRLWVGWPKKASGVISDVTQQQVRTLGLSTGLVDFKICAIDATWSGLCFTRRRK
jgi:hypothetical protein